jgi:hypothetical protein
MMGDLSGMVIDPHGVIVSRGSQPDRGSVVSGVKRLPVPYMMAGRRALAGRFLESEILLSSEIEEGAHGGALVGPAKYDAAGDAQRRIQRDWIGGRPAGCVHGAKHVFLCALQSDIDCIARNA